MAWLVLTPQAYAPPPTDRTRPSPNTCTLDIEVSGPLLSKVSTTLPLKLCRQKQEYLGFKEIREGKIPQANVEKESSWCPGFKSIKDKRTPNELE